jgi:hypothetical protein
MTDVSKIFRKESSISEAAVDGLFAGLLAGLVMAAFLATTDLMRREMLGSLFNRFNPAQAASPWMGLLIHLAISAVYGVLFGLLWGTLIRWRRQASTLVEAVLAGAAYGLLLWLAAQFILLPGSGSALSFLPGGQLLSAHLVYGLILGWRFGRN